MVEIPNPSRRHHHVWQHYLTPWANENAIWCLQERKKIFKTGTRVVAVETDFYKLSDLTDNDIAFITDIFRNSHPLAQDNNKSLLTRLLRPFALVRKAEREGNEKMRLIWSAFAERWAFEALELHHTGVEKAAIPLLDMALRGDLSFHNDDRAIPFYYYLATQHLRTKGVKDRMISVFKSSGYDISRVWNIMIPMSATTLGASLYQRRHSCPLAIIRNETDVSFITGDQPTVNLLADKGSRDKSPERLSLFYPISPNLALIIPDEDQKPIFPLNGINGEEVAQLNDNLAAGCFRQIFGENKASLQTLSIFQAQKG